MLTILLVHFTCPFYLSTVLHDIVVDDVAFHGNGSYMMLHAKGDGTADRQESYVDKTRTKCLNSV